MEQATETPSMAEPKNSASLGSSEAPCYIFNDELGRKLAVLGPAFKALNRDKNGAWSVNFLWHGCHATTYRKTGNPLVALDEAIENIRKI